MDNVFRSRRLFTSGTPIIVMELQDFNGAPALVFWEPGGTRIRRQYPPDWDALDDDALLALRPAKGDE